MSHPGLIALFSGFLAQASKVLVALVGQRQWRPGLLFANGGMPSSHTATVTTLSLAVGSLEGYASSVFSLVLVFSFYVIFEATGLRQEIGHQAQLLNDLMDESLAGQAVDRRRLRELVGHTWPEVAGGMVVGVVVFLVWSRYLA